MKILHIFTLPNTAEGFFDNQFGYLSRNGHEITVVANSELSDEFCSRNQVRSKTAPIARKISLTSDIKAIFSLYREIRRGKYEAVVGHTPKGALIAMIASKLAGCGKRIYFRHGLIYTTASGIRRAIFKTVERLTAYCATDIVNVSHSLNRLAVTDNLNNDKKQTVIGKGTCGGIDTQNLFNPDLIDEKEIGNLRDKLGISKDDFVLGFCGRLCRDKGVIELVEGFELFKKNHPQISVKLLLTGRFDERDALNDTVISKIKNSPDIIAPGVVSHDAMPKYYSLMDLFVFPSYREGFGMCVIEASAMECPILVSHSHGCIDSIKPLVTGEYIEISGPGISHSIESMLDKEKRLRYGKAGREWVVKNFDYKVLWPQIKEFYDKNCNL